MDMRWWALGAVTLGTFMTYLDNNISNVSLPTIQRDLGLTLSGLEWVATGYMLVFAGLMLVGGRLADVIGKRRTFLIGLAVFTLSSMGAGLAPDGATLIAARAVQGVGAALLTPTALALISSIFPDPRERGAAVGIWTASGALSMALGPATGGFISQNLHWGWIYLINVPIGVATFALALWAIRPDTHRVRHSLDLPGLVTSAIALFALTFGLIEGWNLPLVAVTAGSAAAFVLIESRSKQPMIDVSLFRSRVFTGGTLAMGLWSFGVFGIYFFSALWLQNSLGFTPVEAGAAFVPMALVMAVVALQSQRLARLLGNAQTVALGLGLMAVAVLGISSVGADGGYLDVLPWFLLYGLGGGMLVPLTTMILGALPAERAGVASGVLNVSREVFGLLGITVLGAILSARQSQSTFLAAYQSTLVIAAIIVAVGVPVALFSLRRTAQAAMAGASN
ncbi:DHA2 family efflux MFS transporter permease subunit [Nonomuraea dietziae]|uniref:DHA2 family efflux MFS transporter permease subunit n=1 Tax=Nonomuraea dietziae TaxID=65515 RepID=UPI0033F9D21C